MALRYPKNYNRQMVIRKDNAADSGWMLIASGISSRGSNFTENSETYTYWSGRGTSEVVPTSQEISYSYSGNRAIGDTVQDYLFDDILYDLDSRDVEFMDFDDGIDVSGENPPPNGWKGKGTISITDPGSGDANARQTIGFSINLKGKPEKGTVKKEGETYTWLPYTPSVGV